METYFHAIIMILCGFGCGALFHWLGSWAEKRKDPMPFWTGSVVDPKTISDIPAYNRANARMWKQYAVPYWITGICGILSFLIVRFATLAGIVIGLACTAWILWLIYTYKHIEKEYKIQNP